MSSKRATTIQTVVTGVNRSTARSRPKIDLSGMALAGDLVETDREPESSKTPSSLTPMARHHTTHLP
jgi:hypothetical protein